jgi:hypothetical protein
MGFWQKFVIFIAMLLMPLGLFMMIQGGYFYNITSRENTDILVESYLNSMFASQSGEFGELCTAWNISCVSVDSTISAICAKTQELRQQADASVAGLCEEFGTSCRSLENARDVICENMGNDNDVCGQLNTNVESVQSAEKICNDVKGFRTQIDDMKKTAYEQEFSGVSLAKMHSGLSNSVIIGIIIFLICTAAIYIASGNLFTVVNSLIYTVLSTGVIIMLMGMFGYQVVNSMVPSLSTAEFPEVAKNMIKGIFDFEFNTGLILTIIGSACLLTLFLLQKYYFKERVKIYNIWTSV